MGMLKKATSGVLFLRRTYFTEVATKAESGFARAGLHCVVLTYWKYAPRTKMAAAFLHDFFDHSLTASE